MLVSFERCRKQASEQSCSRSSYELAYARAAGGATELCRCPLIRRSTRGEWGGPYWDTRRARRSGPGHPPAWTKHAESVMLEALES